MFQKSRNSSVPRESRNVKPNFLIPSPSSLNKPLQERSNLFNKNEQANVAPFVGNYNVPLQPFTLPDGTMVQANQLKNTFQRFKRELREQTQMENERKGSPGGADTTLNSLKMTSLLSTAARDKQFGKFNNGNYRFYSPIRD